MKKYFVLFLILLSSVFAFAEDTSEETRGLNLKAPVFIFTEGATFNQITRIEVLENRSNFVREAFLAGAYFNMSTVDFLSFLDLELQFSAYYPLEIRFNGMSQKQNNMFNYALDMYFGAKYNYEKLKYINIEASIGLHYMYQLTDEFHLNYVGLGTLDSIVFPISSGWSLVNSYFFSYDNPNLGSNAKVQPYDASYQYHIDLGIRYSRKAPNSYSYIK